MSTARPFQFSHLKKLSRQQLQITEALLSRYPQLEHGEDFAAELMNRLSQDFNLKLQLQYLGLEEMTRGELAQRLSSPCVAYEITAEASGELMVLELDLNLVKTLIPQLVGVENQKEEPFSLSESEAGILDFVMAKTLMIVQAAPGLLGPVSFRIHKKIKDPQELSPPASAEGRACLFQFYLSVGKQGGHIRLYLPHPLTEGLLLREEVAAGLSHDPEALQARMGRVSHVKTELWGEIGRVFLQSAEQSQLEAGDVILFDETQAAMGPHGVSGKAVLRVSPEASIGLLADVVDAQEKLVVKILDFYGGEQ